MGTTFRIGVNLTFANPSPYNAYRWAVEWPTAGLVFEGGVVEIGPSIGLNSCDQRAREPVIDPAYNRARSGGCSSSDTTASRVGKLSEFVMSCKAPGLFRINMIDSRVASEDFTTLFGTEGVIPTLTEGVIIECIPQLPVTLALDTNIANGSGPCTQIDDVSSVPVGSQVQVAVCLLNPNTTVALAAFHYRIRYDDRVVVAPEVPNSGSGLDDNPDANEGATTFTSPIYPTSLGPIWDCHADVGAYPVANTDGTPQDGIGIAFSGGCSSVPFASSTLFQGPLGVITFNATGLGTASLDLLQVELTDDNLFQLGSCAPVTDNPGTCLGATIVVTGESGATSTPTPSAPTPIAPQVTSTPTPRLLEPIVITQTPASRRRGSRGLD